MKHCFFQKRLKRLSLALIVAFSFNSVLFADVIPSDTVYSNTIQKILKSIRKDLEESMTDVNRLLDDYNKLIEEYNRLPDKSTIKELESERDKISNQVLEIDKKIRDAEQDYKEGSINGQEGINKLEKLSEKLRDDVINIFEQAPKLEDHREKLEKLKLQNSNGNSDSGMQSDQAPGSSNSNDNQHGDSGESQSGNSNKALEPSDTDKNSQKLEEKLRKQKNIVETSAMATGVINNGGDLVAGAALKSALSAAASQNGEAGFGSIVGSNLRLKSGSHVDIKGFGLVVGAGKQGESGFYGGFLELGSGNYDSYNDFASLGKTHGKGQSKYIGAGIMLQFDLGDRYYAESTLRVGKISADYKSSDLIEKTTEFKSRRAYFGGHLGFGKIFEINETQNLDLYTKFYLTRLNSDKVKADREEIKFHATNSVRAKIGATYSKRFNDSISGYIGTAFEREFDSNAKATNLTLNKAINSPSLKGNTVSGELGVKFQTPFKPLMFDFHLTGLTGQKQGLSGGLNAEFKF